jgi:hypothetical protein
MNTMKKYRASLAVSVPHNFEIDLEASSEYEAYEKAVEAFDTCSGGEVLEVSDAEPVLDLRDTEKANGVPDGVEITEIKD